MGSEVIHAILDEVKTEIFSNSSTVKKFQNIVEILYKRLYVDVCSLYILNHDQKLELYATEGLSKESINKTFLDLDEGLVGQVAKAKRTLIFSNIWNNENFSYKPETAEDPYYTLLGTPIYEQNLLLGILVIQNKSNKSHPEFQINILEIVATFLSKLILSFEFALSYRVKHKYFDVLIDVKYINKQDACGKVIFHNNKFYGLLGTSVSHDLLIINEVLQEVFTSLSEKEKYYYKILNDHYQFCTRIVRYVSNSLMPDISIKKVCNDIIFYMEDDFVLESYIRRISDILIVEYFNKKISTLRVKETKDDYIVVCKNINTNALLSCATAGLKGLIVEDVANSAGAISVASCLCIPVVTGIDNIFDVFTNRSFVELESSNNLIRVFSDYSIYSEKRKMNYIDNKNTDYNTMKEVFTDCGISFAINVYSDLKILESEKIFDGVVIFRPEVFFATLTSLPDTYVKERFFSNIFSKIYSIDNEKKIHDVDVIFFGYRKNFISVDGGERRADDELYNIDSMLNDTLILKNQLRTIALFADKNVTYHVVLPMITTVEEVFEFLNIVNEEGIKNIKISVLFEIPSLFEQLDSLLQHIGKVYLGCDNLVRYFYALDDYYENLGGCRNMLLTAPFLKFLLKIKDKIAKNDAKCVIVCDVLVDYNAIIVLKSLGFCNFLISSKGFGEISDSSVKSIDYGKIKDIVMQCIDENVFDVYNALRTKNLI